MIAQMKMKTLIIKNLLKIAASKFGYRIVNDTDNPILKEMLLLYDELRLNPHDFLRWDHSLAKLSSTSHLQTVIHCQQPDVLIDVGANRGQFAMAARRVGFEGKIISFEPQSSVREELQSKAEADGNWRIYTCGLGDKAEQIELSIFKDDTFSSTLPISESANDKFGELVALTGKETIELRTLDDVLLEESI